MSATQEAREVKVLTLTGVPGTGKSTLAKEVSQRLSQKGVKVLFIDDYKILTKIAKEHQRRGDQSTFSWGRTDQGSEFFSILPAAYPELSRLVATESAQLIKFAIESDDPEKLLFIFECARGAGEKNREGIPNNVDHYDTDLILPMLHELSVFPFMHFINLEVVVENMDELRKRVLERFQNDQTAAPPFVLEKYLNELGVPELSSVKEIDDLPEALRKLITVNQTIDNTPEKNGSFDQLVESVISWIVNERSLDVSEQVPHTANSQTAD